MNDKYIVSAKTVEEAVSIANEKYSDANHEISYDIIQMPKRGFLGIGAKEAKIQVTVTETKSVEIGSLVNDIRKMKNLTDRSGGYDDGRKSGRQDKNDGKQNRDRQNQNENRKNDRQNQNDNRRNDRQNNQNRDGKQGQEGQKQHDGKHDRRDRNRRDDRKKSGQNRDERRQQPQQPKEAQAPAKPQEAPEKRSALNNQGLPGRRSKQAKPIVTGESGISSSSVTINNTEGLSGFESSAAPQGSFGSSRNSAGGKINNDVKRARKQQIQKAAQNQQTAQKGFDTAESGDPYDRLERLQREDEDRLEAEAASALGTKGETPAVPEHPAEKEAVTEEEMVYALEFANVLIKNMGLSAEARRAEKPEDEKLAVTETATVYPKIEIVGDDASVLIGHHGETLAAIQYLVNLSSLRRSKSGDKDYVKIVVDVENYRDKREATLRTLARRMASRAVKGRRNIYLEPMNAYERRIIHSELQSFNGVSTHSVGSDKDRKIIITYEGGGRRPDRKSGSGYSRERHNTVSDIPPKKPKKIQKVPLEKLTEFLEGSETVSVVEEDE